MWTSSQWPAHLYIHWPFCKNKCHYCDFVAFEKHEQFQEDYHRALLAEIDAFAVHMQTPCNRPVRTMFLGGGTPSLYPLPLMRELFAKLREHFDLSALEEVTIEVNPGGITPEHLACWRSLGINRMSVGIQVLDDEVLARLNRMQTRADVAELFSLAPAYFSNLSADLILGLPGVSERAWQETLDYITAQPITHVSMYLLMVHEKTPLYFRLKKGELILPKEARTMQSYESSVAYLTDKGFEQYEVSNFAQPGFQSIHNCAYWQRYPYKAFGIGGSSFDGACRMTNVKNLNKYLAGTIADFEELLSEQQHRLEAVMLGLRQRSGVDLRRVVYSLGGENRGALDEKIALFKEHQLLEEYKDGIVALTVRGLALEHEIILSLFSTENNSE